MATERTITLHSAIDGMLKARYDRWDARLILTYAGKQAVLEEDECDALLRVIECAVDPVEDIAEYLLEVHGMKPDYRIARWFVDNAQPIAKEVYAA